MSELISFAILGVATGSLYALLGMGITVVYRSSGVVNFAHGGVAVVAEYLYFDLTTHGASTVAAIAVSILGGIVLGGLIFGLAIWPLRGASTLTKGIATLAVLVVLQSATTLRYGPTPQTVRSFLPSGSVRMLGSRVPVANLIIFAFCLALLVVLTLVYRRTRFGLATTAVAESELMVALLGRSSSTIAVINWMVGCGLAAIAGIAIAPLSVISPAQSFVLLIPALAVTLCGRFSSFLVIFGSSLVIGIAQAELYNYSSKSSLLAHLDGLSEAVPFVVVLLVVVLRSQALPSRDFIAAAMPRVGSGRINLGWVIVWLVLAGVLALTLSDIWVIALTTGVVFGVILLSLVVVTGYAGQLSLAQVSIAGVAVLVGSKLVADHSWPMFPAALVGVAATVPVALLVGMPSLRTRGVMLGVVTLGLADALNAMVFQRDDVNGMGQGINVGSASVFGVSIDQTLHPRSYAVFSLVVLALAIVVVANLRRSSVGKMLLAVRANERAAAAIGVRVTFAKLYAFVVSGVIAGTAGILAAWEVPYVVLNRSYDPFQSVNAMVSGTLAGVGYISGAVVGGQALTPGGVGGQVIDNLGFGNYLALITGVLLLITIVLSPNGIVPTNLDAINGGVAALRRRMRRRSADDMVSGAEVAGRPRAGRVQRSEAASFAAARQQPAADRMPERRFRFEVQNLTVTFGATRAVDGVSLVVGGGEILSVIGPNGSGKTTLIDAITGYVASSGEVLMADRSIAPLAAWARNRAGISRSFQSLELFEELTVADNLLAAADGDGWSKWLRCLVWPRRIVPNAAVRYAVREFGLAGDLRRRPSELPYGKRRLLAICRALSTAVLPQVLLLDEPAAGLGEADRSELRRLLRHVADDLGMAVILVEHDVELVMEVSDRVLVLELGKEIAAGRPAEVRSHPDVIRAYLGDSDEDIASQRQQTQPDAEPSFDHATLQEER